MPNSIPASVLANVIPGVLAAGGNDLALNAVFLTSDPSILENSVTPFTSAAAVSAWFGANAPETALANVYFAGYTNATASPGVLYFAQYNSAAVAAYVRGGNVAGLTLAQIQALSGTIALSINGVAQVSPVINLAAATSPSNAATLITTGLQSAAGRFQGTAVQTAGSTTLTVSSVTSGRLAVGATLTGTGVDPGLTVVAFLTGTGGAGTYTVSTSTGFASTTISSPGVGVCTYDAQRQAFVITSPTTGVNSSITVPSASTLATGLNLTAATGAVVSPGANAAVPAALMNQIVTYTQNFATFMTVSEQVLAVKQAFAAWVQTTNQRYLYVCQDSDSNALTPNASSTFGALTRAAQQTGVMPVYDSSGGSIAAFVCGIAAAINQTAQNGRTNFAFRTQSGLVPQITDPTIYANLIGNGYNCYASFANASQFFNQLQPGQIAGPFQWADGYVNQIFLNSQFQAALLNLLQSTPAVPYVARGYNLIRSALAGPIAQGLNFGSIVPGISLSTSQASNIVAATGDSNAAATLQNNGWYLLIRDPGAIVRGNRGSPSILFWYTDGGSIQQITLSSTDVR